MKEKKSAKADLSSKRGLFIEIGLIIVLAIVYIAFEQRSYKAISVNPFDRPVAPVDDDVIVIPYDKIELPPPPPPQQPVLLQEVPDDVKTNPDITVTVEDDPNIPTPDLPKLPIKEEDPKDEPPFIIVEQYPEYTGGDEARLTFLRNNIKYPQAAREIGIQGTVYVNFVVEKDGSITQIKIIRGIGGGCDEEAMRVVQMMPKWKPGKQRGKEVRVAYDMPIKFTLRD